MRIALILAGTLAAGIGLGATFAPRRGSTPAIVIPAPSVVVVTPPVAPPPVAPPPVAPPPVPSPAPPAPRALAPRLEARCLPGMGHDATGDARLSCTWDDGFPAISRDGTTIVTKEYIPVFEDHGSGAHLVLRFIDTRTSKVTRTATLVHPDDVDEGGTIPETMYGTVVARVKKSQATIDAGSYRSLTMLGSLRNREPSADPTLRAEFAGDAIRLIDAAANGAVWQESFPQASVTDGELYEPNHSVWWDAATRQLLAVIMSCEGTAHGCSDRASYRVRHAAGG